MTLRALLAVLCLSTASALRAADAVSLPPAPPRPVPPDWENVADSERRSAQRKFSDEMNAWRAAMKTWREALTPAQKTQLEEQEKAAELQRQARMARSGRLPQRSDDYSWQEEAKHWNLDAATIARLQRDKLAYGGSVKQSFSPYLGGPVFITSDSLLNAYHVLFEDSFREYELRQTEALRTNLEIVLQQARKNLEDSGAQAEAGAAWRQAQLGVGPAMVLLGGSAELLDADTREEITRQVALIRAASSRELPTWLAPATDKCPWIDYATCKPVGFYADDSKLADYFRAVRWLQSVPFRGSRPLEFGAIGLLGYGLGRAFQTGASQFFRDYTLLAGPALELGLSDAPYNFQNFLRRGQTWEAALATARKWAVDARRVTSDADEMRALAQVEYRIFPPGAPLDSRMFQRLADANQNPEGLAIATMLGSPFARTHLRNLTPDQVRVALPHIDSSEGRLPSLPSVYDDYLAVLKTLFSPPPDGAPAFMRSDAWAAKTTQTALAGWAQQRHAFTLQARISQHYLGMVSTPPGFIEANSEFFSRFADLVERARPMLDAQRGRWDQLASVARKLEALCYKQLRGTPWSAADEQFIKTYGEKLGGIMGYGGNAYLQPKDDAPRWAEVHRDLQTGSLLAVGVGRPRVLYILYPWNGMEILCRGSVMPYYEYSTKDRLTDGEWKQLLDSPAAPKQPEWVEAPR